MSAQGNKPQEPKTGTGPQAQKDSAGDILRIRDAVYLAGGGIVLTIVLVLILLGFGWKSTDSSAIVAVVGAFTTLVGTLVGYFVGGGVGSQGKAKADQRTDAANERAANAEQKAANAKAFAEVAKGKLSKHTGGGVKGFTVDSAAIQADLKELDDLSTKLL